MLSKYFKNISVTWQKIVILLSPLTVSKEVFKLVEGTSILGRKRVQAMVVVLFA